MLLARLLDRLVVTGRLNVVDADGRVHVFEGEPGPEVTIRFHDPAVARAIFLNPTLCLGEAYMDGRMTVENGARIYDLLDFFGRNLERLGPNGLSRLRMRWDRAFRFLQQYNPIGRARRNVAHHYDLSSQFYGLFLDKDRQYSCAYFPTGEETLEQSQELKKQHIAAKLRIQPGQKVLDIGCGWGGLGLYLARDLKADVVGVTLSSEQVEYARARAAPAHLGPRLQFDLRDYRQQQGTFDRIVSIGMFEHVGVYQYDTFFNKIRTLLADNGVALLHTIGRMEGPGTTNPWIRKYIFPGGYIPALSEVVQAVERAGLWIADVEVLRLHYAQTLRHWRGRFLDHWAEAAAIYDERFCRMWEFYLGASEIAFRYLRNCVFQVQLVKRQDAAPLTRDYIADLERSWQREAAHRAA